MRQRETWGACGVRRTYAQLRTLALAQAQGRGLRRFAGHGPASVRNLRMASAPKQVTLREPGVAGSYELVERRPDGSLLLRPKPERLSDVVRETEGQVFRDEEFAEHLERVAASEDDPPADPPA